MLASLGHPCKFQWVSPLGSVTAQQSSSGRQPDFAVLNRGCHLPVYSSGRPSRWALAHILGRFYNVNRTVHLSEPVLIVMATQCNRPAIIFLPCGFYLCFFLLFFPRLIPVATDLMSAILRHAVWPSANLECRSEMSCARLTENAGPKKSPSGHHRTTLSAISSQVRHVSTIGKKTC